METNLNNQISEEWTVSEDAIGQRIDQYLSHKFPEQSRATIQQWIKQGYVKIDGNDTKSKFLLKGFEKIHVELVLQDRTEHLPQEMPLDICYEDEHLLILNKPVGLVVHPGSGNPDNTLLNGLLAYSSEQKKLVRAGIVHRLDKDTSGLMVVAKDGETQQRLIDLLKEHDIKREYVAIVRGQLSHTGHVDQPIGRHPTQRVRMAVHHKGKPAITHYQPLRVFKHFSLMKLNLETGRTHQIRVHMHHLGHPLVGDPLYGNPNRIAADVVSELKDLVRAFPRQALHARQLEFIHPITQQPISIKIGLPEDMEQLLEDIEYYDDLDTFDDQMDVEYVE
ncbi:23S rRNA pseudouridine(1911/1915/1917) synthase RluD [Marinicella sp. W31]|uniref:23S rRNA pseudouridine(1911/1915/1917) synthase RluD n=1 Tax=Marinicella sp. W31 TaxID=3023713 RepID=UPI0037571995